MKKLVMSRKLNMMAFALKENSPKIFLISGIVAGGGCVVFAIRQTLKASKKIDKMKADISTIKETIGKEYYEEDSEVKADISATQIYTEEDAKNDSVIVYRDFVIDMAKLYAPVAGLGVLSLFMILKAYGIVNGRYIATAAALASAEKAFGDYRQRVRDRYGDEVENDILHGVKTVKIEGTRVDENGKEKKFKETVDLVDPDEVANDIYTRLITRSNACWDESVDYMVNLFNAQQKYANDVLQARGFLTLNEAYKLFCLEENAAGMVVGWIYSDDNEEGDNKVEFNVKRVNILDRDGVTVIPAYSISFNVDGNIYKRLAENY